MQKITPFLWFDSQAEEAANFYVSIFKNSGFKNSQIGSIARYPEGSPGPAGKVMTVEFQLDGQDFVALNGGPVYTFTPAISFHVNCESQSEVDDLWAKLSSGGNEVQCGWLEDKFGISWQIIPTALGQLLKDKDRAKSQRVMQAMLKMVKIDIAALQRTYDNN
jgi:predicted 3-demethylubiquinone-9 3-methyltransferase (glyoxalase superfamily)